MSTVYSTNIVTITSCAPTVTNCPVGKVTTEVVSLYTTVCPVTNTVLDGTTYTGKVSQVGTTAASVSTGSVGTSASPASEVPPASTSLSVLPSTQSTSDTPVQQSTTPVELTTSTVYSTNVYTITSCAPSVTNCPAKLGQVTTELVSLYTTICPVTQLETGSTQSSVLAVSTSTSDMPTTSSASSPPALTTSTVYTSSVYTVSTCEEGAADCSSKIGSVTTEVVALYTTIYPIEQATQATPKTSTKTIVTSVSSVLSEMSSTIAKGVPFSESPVATSSSSEVPLYTTSTVYSTNIYTVTSCAPDVTNCPTKLGAVTTEVIAISTTVCPVSDKGIPTATGITSVPPVVASDSATTATVTLSNTFSDSVIVITSVITFVDTESPDHPTEALSTSNAAETGAVQFTSGNYQNISRPCTTVTLGSYFTTVITYASITLEGPSSVSVAPGGSVATSYYTLTATATATLTSSEADVPSYTMSYAVPTSTAAMSTSTSSRLVPESFLPLVLTILFPILLAEAILERISSPFVF